jgi:hypothetical protein
VFEVDPKVLTKDFGVHFKMSFVFSTLSDKIHIPLVIIQKHLHIQHQAPKSLNINAKMMVVKVAPSHFHPTPKCFGVF